jgi:hypothetical protein
MASAASASKHAEYSNLGDPPVGPRWSPGGWPVGRRLTVFTALPLTTIHLPPPTFRMPQATCDLLPATRHIPLRSPLPLPLLLLPLPLPLPLPLLTTLNPCPPLTRYRPCERCVKYGLTDCVDSTRKPRKTGVKR